MTRARFITSLSLMLMLLMSLMPTSALDWQPDAVQNQEVSARSSGIDIRPTAFSFEYSNTVDFESYGLLSSYQCCETVTRPATLWLVDGMLNADQTISVTIENSGTTNSGQFDVRVYVLHNEYTDFLIFDQTTSIVDLGGGSTTTIQLSWVPDYSGNHTIHAVALHTNDDAPGNDDLSRHYTIGTSYENANAAGIWNPAGNWGLDTDNGISPHDYQSSWNGYRTSFYIGNEATDQYGNNWVEDMYSNSLDFSDRVDNPNRNFLIGFLWTGSSQPGDNLYLHVENQNGWKGLATINAQLDATASNWQLLTLNLAANDLHSSTRFRFEFISNSADTDAGYWLDDIVIIYDQQPRDSEYDPGLTTPSAGGAAAGEWSSHDFTLRNMGNLEDKIGFEMPDIPADWDWRVTFRNGGPVDPVNGLQVERDGTRDLTLLVQPSSNASLGMDNFTLEAISRNAPTSTRSANVAFEVLPTYLPLISRLETEPSCRPGTNCEFSVQLTNAGDATDTYDLTADIILLRANWSLGLAWDQELDITLDPLESSPVRFLVAVPFSAIPGQFSSIVLTATSTQRPDISATYRINATAGMISDAAFAVDFSSLSADDLSPLPGDSVQIPFTIWNNATTYDIFSICLEVIGARTWVVSSNHQGLLTPEGSSCATPFEIEVPGYSDVQIFVEFEVPLNAQAGDIGPLLQPTVISSRSTDIITAIPFHDLSVRMIHSIELVSISSPLYLSPGGESEFEFEVTNDGNGHESVVFDVTGLESGWSYWFVADGVILDTELPLTPAYEGMQTGGFTLVVAIPIEVDGGEVVEFSVSAQSASGELDSTPLDNTFAYSGWTAMVFEPVWVVEPAETIQVSAGTLVILDTTLTNLGNAFDSQLRLKFEIETRMGLTGVLAYMITEEESETYFGAGEWASIPLARDAEIEIQIQLSIPSGAPIPSELSLIWFIEGGANQLGDYTMLENETLIEVSIYRDVSADLGLNSGKVLTESIQFFSIDITSRSTIIEDLNLAFEIPEGWILECSDGEADGEFHLFLPAATTGSSRQASMDCSLLVPDDAGRHSLNLTLVDGDGTVVESWTVDYIAESPDTPGLFGSFGGNVGLLGIVVAFAGIILVLLLVLMLQRREEEYEEYDAADSNQATTGEAQRVSAAYAHQQQLVAQQQTANAIQQSQILQQQAVSSSFQQPLSAPESAESLSLEDAFGSLIPAEEEQKQDEQPSESA